MDPKVGATEPEESTDALAPESSAEEVGPEAKTPSGTPEADAESAPEAPEDSPSDLLGWLRSAPLPEMNGQRFVLVFLYGLAFLSPVCGSWVVLAYIGVAKASLGTLLTVFFAWLVLAVILIFGVKLFTAYLQQRVARQLSPEIASVLGASSELFFQRKFKLAFEKVADTHKELTSNVRGALHDLTTLGRWLWIFSQWRHLTLLAFLAFGAMLGEVLIYWQLEVGRDQLMVMTRQNNLFARQNQHLLRQFGATTRTQQLDIIFSEIRAPSGARFVPPRPRTSPVQREAALRELIGLEQTLQRQIPARGLQLAGALLTDLKLPGINLPGVDLTGAYLINAQLPDAKLNQAKLQRSHLAGARFSRARMTGARLDLAEGRGVFFDAAQMSEASLREVRFEASSFINANLTRADLSGSYLPSAKLDRAQLREANLLRAGLPSARMPQVNLLGADLQLADLSGSVATLSNLREANLGGTQFSNADLYAADLSSSIAGGLVLKNTNLTEANLSDLRFPKGSRPWKLQLAGALLDRTKIYGTNLRDHTLGLTQPQLDSTCGDSRSTVPAGLDRPQHWFADVVEPPYPVDPPGCPPRAD